MPQTFVEKIAVDLDADHKVHAGNYISNKPTEIKIIEGELIFCHKDNLNTDGIYAGKNTYIDEFNAKQQAKVVMENYDPSFWRKKCRKMIS